MYTRQFTHLDGHNAYDLLGLDRWASRGEIEAARRRLAVRVHPDLPSGDAEWMSLINAAAAILLDEAQRESYDDYLETRAAAARAARQWAPRPATRVPRAGSDAGRRRQPSPRPGPSPRTGPSPQPRPRPRPRPAAEGWEDAIATPAGRAPLRWQPPPPGPLARWRTSRRASRVAARGEVAEARRVARQRSPLVILGVFAIVLAVCAVSGALLGYGT